MEDNLDKVEPDLKAAFQAYIDANDDRAKQREVKDAILKGVKASKVEEVKPLLKYERDLVSKSVWIVGGDGWAYDIGYGGLDHVIANDLDVNVLVLDTEVYSNTGGQSSKSSQASSIAKFAAGGKKTAKKDLGQIAMRMMNNVCMLWVVIINISAISSGSIRRISPGFSPISVASTISSLSGCRSRMATTSFSGALPPSITTQFPCGFVAHISASSGPAPSSPIMLLPTHSKTSVT